jgi:uncharacterized protein YbjT (DUF2867 family)
MSDSTAPERVLVTGASGTLGRPTVRAAHRSGWTVRAQSRQPRTRAPGETIDWVKADLATGNGVEAIVAGTHTILHLAGDPAKPRAVDIDGTRRLLDAARGADVQHIVYISIVGIERIPLPYYRAKLQAEALVRESGLPHSILRATQFHELMHGMLSSLARFPFLVPIPAGLRFQSVAAAEVADRLVACLSRGPAGRLPDLGGPEILLVRDMARVWRSATRRRKPIVPLPVVGRVASAFRAGAGTVTDGDAGNVTWEDWLAGWG